MESIKAYKPQSNPLRFMWIAHFDNGTSLPEFDPFKFTANSFKEVLDNEDKVIKFGLYPIPPSLSNGLKSKGINETISIPFLPHYEVNLNKYRRLIFYRRTFISNETYHKCLSCNKEYQNVGIKYTTGEQPSPICPNCGAHDIFVCGGCKKEYQRFDDAPNHMCSCGRYLSKKAITSIRGGRERRYREYHIGFQETINGINKKYILKIDENGHVEVLDI